MRTSLRDHIAQKLFRMYADSLVMKDDMPWSDVHPATQERWRKDADAVIAELEGRYVLVPKSETLAALWKHTAERLEDEDDE